MGQAIRANGQLFKVGGLGGASRLLLLVGLGLFLAFLLLYLGTLSAHYAPDGMAFTMLTTHGDLRQSTFFQAEHLLYPFGGWLWYRLWQWWGFQGGALVPLQVLNALFGALGVACFFGGLLNCLGQRRAMAISLVVAVLLGVSLGYWQHSTDVEDQIIATSLVLASFMALGRMRRPGRFHPWGPISAGTLGLAIVFHATSVLVIPAFFWGLWSMRHKSSEALGWALVLAAVVAVPYLAVGWLVKGFSSVYDYLAWASFAPQVGVWGQGDPGSLWQGLKSLVNALFSWPGGANFRTLAQGQVEALPGVAAFVVVLAGLAALAGAVIGQGVRRRWTLAGTMGLIWALPVAAFALFWAPEDVQFWVGVWPPLLLLSVALVQERSKPGKALLLLSGLAGVIFLGNLLLNMLPRRDLSANADYAKALCLREHTSPQDLVITPGWDWVTTYVPYFAQRRVFSLVDTLVLSAGRDEMVMLQLLNEEAQRTRALDGRVYVARLGDMSPEERRWFQRATGLEVERLSLAGQEAWRCQKEPIWHWAGLEPASH